MTGDEYIAANRGLDEKLERLVWAKAKLATALRPTHQEDFADASIRHSAQQQKPACRTAPISRRTVAFWSITSNE